MKTFDELYPDLKYLDQVPIEDHFIIKGKEPRCCWNCGMPTYFIEGDFQAPLCSPECVKQKWEEFKSS